MASRGGGRGRGRGQLTFNMEAVGIGKGDALPPPTLQPSPLFPPLEFHPVPLPAGEEGEYVLALKQELRGAMRQLPYFIRPAVPKRDVERYSDKYQMSGPIDNAIDWNPDWRRLPSELKIRVRKVQKERTTIILPKRPPKSTEDKEETIQKLETLEKKEEEVTSEEDEEKEEEEEKEEGEEEEYDEEEHEEETDYIMSYFDNGEDFGALPCGHIEERLCSAV
ncbi:DNA-directed RNA polymerase III subunit RPC7-like isoform X2 [Rattus norvegicus]|uniref:DNA-directed RNA polymerase III subunit n=2 Tax=Rattus norvegicus TaxID=10116 RepID=A0ABK0LW25_RAT